MAKEIWQGDTRQTSRNCVRCGKIFKTRRKNKKYCTEVCKNKTWAEKNPRVLINIKTGTKQKEIFLFILKALEDDSTSEIRKITKDLLLDLIAGEDYK